MHSLTPCCQALLDALLFIRFALANQDQPCPEDVRATLTFERKGEWGELSTVS